MYYTQSFIKDVLAYSRKKECGLIIKAKYYDGRWSLFTTDSESMDLGNWAEFMMTGAMPTNKEIPQPKTTAKGELTAAYKNMLPHIERFHKMMAMHGFKILYKAHNVVVDNLKAKYDIIAECTQDIYSYYAGEKRLVAKKGDWVIIDIKTTGKMDDKWDDYGWNMDMLNRKEKIIVQPLHYTYVGLKEWGIKMPFLFFLFDTKDENYSKIINFVVSDTEVDIYEQSLEAIMSRVATYEKEGYKTIPQVKRCLDCPLKFECSEYAVIPIIEDFYFSSDNA